MLECRAIQEHLRENDHPKATANSEESALRSLPALCGFTKLMLLGNIRGTLRVLSQTSSGGVLSLSAHMEVNGEQRRVFDILKNKHPQSPAAAHPDALVDEALAGSPLLHSVLFEQITGDTIRSAALRTEGSAESSGIGVTGWRRMCTAFHGASMSLCNALAAVTRALSMLPQHPCTH